MSQMKSSMIPGILLIVIGALLLFNEMNWFPFQWYRLYPILLLLTGAGLIVIAFTNKSGNAMFWGSLIFLFGVLYFLRNFGLLGYFALEDIWPVFFIILGLSFIAIMLVNPGDWGVLIPGGIFLFFGSLLFMRTLNLWWAHHIMATYWPLLLVLVGVIVIVTSIRNNS
jgi:hypothetical protein